MSFMMPQVDTVLAAALAEDLGVPAEGLLGGVIGPEVLDRDVTSAAVVPADATFRGVIAAREAGVVCGLPAVEGVYAMLSRAANAGGPVEVYPLVAEGTPVHAGASVAEVEGPARIVLAGERTALNVLMALSGIATTAARWQTEAGPELAVLDTRKTLPGLRALSKYAVAVGGAHNHRLGLYDMVLVKDNHIAYVGGVTQAVEAARSAQPELVVEIEADTIEQAVEAARAGADIVLLDNMDDETLRTAVAAVKVAASEAGHITLTEASGDIRFDRLAALRRIGVDRVSTSALTLAPPLDFGLDEVNPGTARG